MARRYRTAIFSLSAIVVLVGGGLIAYRLTSGRSMGIRNFLGNIPRAAVSMVRAVAGHRNVIANSRGEFTNLVFLHHSVGANLIAEGHLRDEVTKDGYTFYDHGYNSEGLTGPDGIALG